MAISGERSSQALPTPVVRLVAPGPSVAMQSPGAPVMRPVTSAAKPAEPSCAVSTTISGSTLPLGMPKPRVTPFAFSVAMIRSALFMVATNRARRFSTGVGSRNRCSGRFPAHSLAKVTLDHAEIGAGARDQIGDGNALVLGVPLFDGARPPHR